MRKRRVLPCPRYQAVVACALLTVSARRTLSECSVVQCRHEYRTRPQVVGALQSKAAITGWTQGAS